MAAVVTSTSLLVTIITVGLVFIPAIVGQAQCTNTTLVATGDAKFITSPGYPYNYSSLTNCQWHITADLSSRVITLTLVDFYLEESPSPSCSNDYVAIYDGSSTSSPRIQLLCGQVSVTQFTSTGPSMTVVFHSNNLYNSRGFEFEYTSLDKSDSCTNGILSATRTAKFITSPGYPNNYPSYMVCHWSITADLSSRVVMLKLLDFYLEGSPPSCSNSYVAIYDGSNTRSPRIQLLCGQVPITQFTSTGPSMTVEFLSGEGSNFRGFKFQFTSLEKSVACTNGILSATATGKYLYSPGYHIYYASEMSCQWRITADLPSHVVVLKLLDFYLESPSCINDNVAFFDGSSTSSPRTQLLCGQVPVTQFISSGPSMTVVFHSGWSYYPRGFKFEYTSQDKSDACTDGILSATQTGKYITSPGYPNNYPSYISCQWYITADLFSRLVVLKLLDFYLKESSSCSNDYVAIYDGYSTSSPRIQLLCGQVPITQIISTGPSMTVVFHSGGSYNFRGFKFEYTSEDKSALCTNSTLVATGTAKYITTPWYPKNYPSDMTCLWHITADWNSNVIMLKVLYFYLEGSSTCNSAYVAIYDGSSTSSPRIQLLCGQVPITQITSTGPSMTVVFHSDRSDNFRGFKLEYTSLYKSDACTDSILSATGTAKYLYSPGYPANYPSNMSCQWYITADLSSHVVMLKLLDFYLEDSSSCNNDYVAIYDGDSTSSRRKQLLCGQHSNTQFFSSGPSMTVVFHSDGSDSYKGFKFAYTSFDLSDACTDGILSATETGKYITSPGYPNIYPSYMDCQWHITAVLSSSVVVLKLLDFYLGNNLYCDSDYVAIYDGSSTNSSRIQLLCDPDSITQFFSSGPSMTFVFHSNGNFNFRGFKFEYTSLDMSDLCTNNTLLATGTAKYITSPGYPNNYQSYVGCQWRITADLPSRVVVLKLLDFYLEGSSSCSYDYVAVYNGDRTQLLCGQISTTQLTSIGHSMTVVFHSDGSNNFRGFMFEYTSLYTSDACADGILSATATGKSLTSPGYPSNYPSNTDCQWHITADSDSRVVVLSYSQFNVEESNAGCTSDYVKIYDGPSTSSPLIKVMCGHMNDGTFTSTDSYMTIVFHSDGGIKFFNTGFRFFYQSKEKEPNINYDNGFKVTDYMNPGIIVGIIAACIGLPFIIVVLAVCVKRMVSKSPQGNIPNRGSRPNRATGRRGNPLFIVNLPTTSIATPPYAGVMDSQSLFDPPPYSSLKFTDSLPAYTPRNPSYSVSELPPYSRDLPGGTALNPQTALHKDSSPGKAFTGVVTISDGRAHLNRGFNSTSRDEVVRGHVTSLNVATEVNL